MDLQNRSVKLLVNEIIRVRCQCDNLKQQAKIHRRESLRHKKRAELLQKVIVMQSFNIDPNRRIWSLCRTSKFWEEEVGKNSESKFKEDFRMSRDTFNFLTESVSFLKREDTRLRPAISLEKRVAIALYSLASSCEFRTVANCFGVGRSTVGEIIIEFCAAICSRFENDYLDFYPPTLTKISEIVAGFEEKWGFPQTYGAVDGCHIEVNPPEEQAVDYYNYKGWHSVVLLAAVDYKYRFTHINIGSPGRNNDSYIFETSRLKQQHENNPLFSDMRKVINNISVPVLLIGDSAFRMSPFLVKPYPGSDLPPVQKNFNKSLSRARRVVENAFGHLKATFRRVGKGLEVNIENVPVIITACCLLHNILIDRKEEMPSQWLHETSSQNANGNRLEPNHSTTVGDSNPTAVEIRNAIANYLYEKENQGIMVQK